MKKIEKYKYRSDLVAIFIFLVVTFTMTYPLWHSHQLFIANDWSFHVSRVEEIYDNLKDGHLFTYIATHTFQKTGVTNFLFYPTFFLYPWALLRFIFSPVTAFYGWYALINFCTLVIAYLCAKKVSNSSIKAILASLLYTLMPYHMFVGTGVFGEFVAMAFIPMVILGGYELFFADDHRWQLLAIGLALVSYCHILSTLLCIEILSILFIISLFTKKWSNIDRIKALLKSVVLTISLVAMMVGPFVSDYIGQKISSTNSEINFNMILKLKDFIFSSFSGSYGQNLGFVLVIALLTGYIYFNNRFVITVWLLGSTLALVTTDFFPWEKLQNIVPALGVIQFPYRYLSYAGLFLALIASEAIGSSILKLEKRKQLVAMVAVLVVAAVYPLSVLHTRDWRTDSSLDTISVKVQQSGPQGTPVAYKVNNQTYSEIFSHGVLYGEADYFPKQSWGGNSAAYYGIVINNPKLRSIIDSYAYIDGQKTKISKKSGPNKLEMSLNDVKGKKINLPVVAYRNTYLQVNGKNVNYQKSSRGTVQFTSQSKKVNIVVGFKPSMVMIIGYIVSSLGWLFVLLMLIRSLRSKIKQ